jgi:hypothetical protein
MYLKALNYDATFELAKASPTTPFLIWPISPFIFWKVQILNNFSSDIGLKLFPLLL